jgi:hypothetical protein
MLPRSAITWVARAESVPDPRSATRARSAPIVQEFALARGGASWGVPMSRATLAGFIAAKVTVEAIRRGGSVPTGADLRRVLATLQHYDVGGITFDFSREHGGGTRYARLGIVAANGAVVN